MDMIQTTAQGRTGRWPFAIAIFAITCNLLSWAALNYEIYLVEMRILHHESLPANLDALIEELLWLCPVIVVTLFRQIMRITVPYAFVFFWILVGRCYYLLEFHFMGAGALRGPFDWASLLQ